MSCLLELVQGKHTIDWQARYRGKSWRVPAASNGPALAGPSILLPERHGATLWQRCQCLGANAAGRRHRGSPRGSVRRPANLSRAKQRARRAGRVRGSANDNGRPIGLPLGIADWAEPLGRALTGAVANVELTGAQALVGDVGCEKVGQGERRPQQGNGVMAP
jgi:hypothetical protein